jgi:hypothetical protein
VPRMCVDFIFLSSWIVAAAADWPSCASPEGRAPALTLQP